MVVVSLEISHGYAHNTKLCEWPGYSPDFNTIELVWNIIKQKTKNKNPKSQRELENAIDEALNDLSLNVIQACIKKGSESTRTACIFILSFDIYYKRLHVCYLYISKKTSFDHIFDVLD